MNSIQLTIPSSSRGMFVIGTTNIFLIDECDEGQHNNTSWPYT